MSETVLIVDDSLTVRMNLVDAFERSGFTPIPCSTVAEARIAFAKSDVAVVVLDVLLPDGDGIELLSEFRASADGVNVVILMLSSEAEVKDRLRGFRTGADDYVGKPYDEGYVVAKARELLGTKRNVVASERTTVLIIDDSVTFREGLRTALTGEGIAVLTAASGEEGLRLAATTRPNAIVVDGVLPGIDGATVIRRVRLDVALRGVPCVLLTGSEDRGAELRALDAGADAFVRKDEPMDVILARLSAVLRRGRSNIEDRTTSSFGPQKILAVDDSATYLQALAGTLREEGYEVVLAHTGEEALELLSVDVVDCILLDLMMPGLGGQETCRRIKSVPIVRDIPLILLTAVEDRSTMINGLGAGADDYISKSSEMEVLKARVRAQIRRKKFEDETRRIRDELLQKELEAVEARAMKEVAETRAALVEELQKKNAELERMSRYKSQFLANASHELRTPLNAIIGFSELLTAVDTGEPLSPRQREQMQHVLTSGRHLLSLINDILDLSKVEAGKLDVTLVETSIAEVAKNAYEVVAPLAEKSGIRIHVEIPDDLPPIMADPLRLRQVLFNLLSNGIKFTREGGAVSVEARSFQQSLEISVRDTGVGIRAEDLPRLFREFEQAPSSREALNVEGSGLGLALTKRLVELHGGTISAASEYGHGSVFTIRFALRPPTASHTSPRIEMARVMVVDGDGPSRRLACDVVRMQGHEVIEALNVEDALARLERDRPQLLVADIESGGAETLLNAIRKASTLKRMTVVATTSRTKIGDRERLLSLGFDDCLNKPIGVQHLKSVVEAMLIKSLKS